MRARPSSFTSLSVNQYISDTRTGGASHDMIVPDFIMKSSRTSDCARHDVDINGGGGK